MDAKQGLLFMTVLVDKSLSKKKYSCKYIYHYQQKMVVKGFKMWLYQRTFSFIYTWLQILAAGYVAN